MRAKTARWVSRDDYKPRDELGGRNIWLLVVVGGVSSRTPLSWCLPLVCVTGSSLARITYAYGPGLLLVDSRLFSGWPETAGAHGHPPPRPQLPREPVVGLAVRFLHVDVASQTFLEVQ
jgi:hypothetical protein